MGRDAVGLEPCPSHAKAFCEGMKLLEIDAVCEEVTAGDSTASHPPSPVHELVDVDRHGSKLVHSSGAGGVGDVETMKPWSDGCA